VNQMLPRIRLVTKILTGALTGAILLGGCNSSATSASTDHNSASMPAAGGSHASAPTNGQRLSFTDYSTSDRPTSTVVLTGAVGDYGTATRISDTGTIDPRHGGELKLVLSKGSFRLNIAGLEHELVSAFRDFPANHSTCSGAVRRTDTAPIVESSGTGAYKGISGSLTMTVSIAEVDPKSQCDSSGAFLAQIVLLTGSGTIQLG
jgi:hypothetical protein